MHPIVLLGGAVVGGTLLYKGGSKLLDLYSSHKRTKRLLERKRRLDALLKHLKGRLDEVRSLLGIKQEFELLLSNKGSMGTIQGTRITINYVKLGRALDRFEGFLAKQKSIEMALLGHELGHWLDKADPALFDNNFYRQGRELNADQIAGIVVVLSGLDLASVERVWRDFEGCDRAECTHPGPERRIAALREGYAFGQSYKG